MKEFTKMENYKENEELLENEEVFQLIKISNQAGLGHMKMMEEC